MWFEVLKCFSFLHEATRELHLNQATVWIISERVDKKWWGRNNIQLYSAKFYYTWLYLINVTPSHYRLYISSCYFVDSIIDSSRFSLGKKSLSFLENQPLFETFSEASPKKTDKNFIWNLLLRVVTKGGTRLLIHIFWQHFNTRKIYMIQHQIKLLLIL